MEVKFFSCKKSFQSLLNLTPRLLKLNQFSVFTPRVIGYKWCMKKRFPFAITTLSVVLGVFIAIMFGVNEDFFRKKIEAGLEKNVKIMAIEDVAKKEATLKTESEKNWRYYQRFHFHSTGIAAMSFGLLLMLSFLNAPAVLKSTASYLVSVGGFLYPFVWLFAGIYGPEMGRSEAKEAFAIFGYMGGVFLLGALLSFYLSLRYDFSNNVAKGA